MTGRYLCEFLDVTTLTNIARVFPRKTAATPTDELAFFDAPPMLALPQIDEIHISVVFTYDIQKAEWLENQWRQVGVPVKIGGPAYSQRGEDFTPGLYLKHGNVITSRGCPNNCWFCSVPKRDGKLRELKIHDGFNIRDDNILACSDEHIKSVFQMLERQKERPIFSGGLESRLLKSWHADLLKKVKTQSMYFAYDSDDDLEPLIEAGKTMRDAGFTPAGHSMHCYVLIGQKGDTFDKALERINKTIQAGFMPYAMLFRDDTGEVDETWRRFQREWCNPTIVAANMRKLI